MKAIAVFLVLALALIACGSPQTVVVVTATAQPTDRPTPTERPALTARPTSRPAPTRPPTQPVAALSLAFDPGSGWTPVPQYNGSCDFTCESWMYGGDGALLLQVRPDVLTFGIDIYASDIEHLGEVMAEVMYNWGVPLSVLDDLADAMFATDLGFHSSGGWYYDLAVSEDLITVSIGP